MKIHASASASRSFGCLDGLRALYDLDATKPLHLAQCTLRYLRISASSLASVNAWIQRFATRP